MPQLLHYVSGFAKLALRHNASERIAPVYYALATITDGRSYDKTGNMVDITTWLNSFVTLDIASVTIDTIIATSTDDTITYPEDSLAAWQAEHRQPETAADSDLGVNTAREADTGLSDMDLTTLYVVYDRLCDAIGNGHDAWRIVHEHAPWLATRLSDLLDALTGIEDEIFIEIDKAQKGQE